MNDYLESVSEATNTIKQSARYLQRLSESFYLTGNEKMADNLELVALDLLKSEEDLQSAISKDINDQHNRSMQSTANMINACLVVGSKNEATP